jgi:hypothetical protein
MKTLSCTGLLILAFHFGYASGPSSIQKEIHPVSVNANGDILCRTRMIDNPEGTFIPKLMEYGYCIISSDTVITFPYKQLDPDTKSDFEAFKQFRDHYDSVFWSCIDADRLNDVERMIYEKYQFKFCNADSGRVDQRFSVSDLEKLKNIHLEEFSQKSFDGSASKNWYLQNSIHILYDFGNILILNNVFEYEGRATGTDFGDFYIKTDATGMKKKVDYEVRMVSGILFMDHASR